MDSPFGQYDNDTLHCEWVEAFPHLCCQTYCRKKRFWPTSLEVHNNSKSNPVDEASPGVTANMFIRNDRWGEEPNLLSSLEPEWQDCTQEYAIRQNLSLPLGMLTKKQHLFQEKMATSSVFDKCFLVSLKIRIPSFAAGAPQMVPPKEKTHYWRHDYCRWWINAQQYMGDWSNHGLLFLIKNVFFTPL